MVFIFCKLCKLQNPTVTKMVIHEQSLKLVSELLYIVIIIIFSCRKELLLQINILCTLCYFSMKGKGIQMITLILTLTVLLN